MRDEKEERSNQDQTNDKAKQHSIPKAVTFPKKNELPQVGLEPTPLHTLDRVLSCIYIREYGSTLYIGIAMVFYCTFGPMQKLKFPFSLPYSTQFQFYQHQSE